MATRNHNLSKFDAPLPSAEDMRFGIVVAEWNREVTEALLEGAVRTLRAAGCPDMNIQIKYVPGTFELSLGAQFFAEYTDVDAVIALGCVIQGIRAISTLSVRASRRGLPNCRSSGTCRSPSAC